LGFYSRIVGIFQNVGISRAIFPTQICKPPHTLGANAVNQFIASGQWYSALFNVPNLPAALQAQPFRLAFAGGAFSSLGRLLNIVPQGRNVTQYQFVDDFSIAKGNHSLKFGLSFRRNDITDFDPGIGSIGASQGTTLQNFFNGIGGTYFQSFPSQPSQPIALYALGFYAQDEWSVKPNLKLTFSLRGEHFSDPVCQTNCFARLSGDFLNVSHDVNQPYNQAIVSGQTGVQVEAALAYAMAGDSGRADSIAQELSKRYPLNTQVQSLWLPSIQAQLALNREDAASAINRLQAALPPIEYGQINFVANISCLYPTYLRGQVYLAARKGKEAAAEFQKILDHSGLVWNCWTGALAHLGLARANALQARNSQGADADAARVRALAAYKDFLTLWKDADSDIPSYKQAKAEYAKLQ
jgi:tetratricopeptide (TPR) repeat protein